MKYIALTVFSLFLLPLNGVAAEMRLDATCNFNAAQGTCAAQNTFPFPARCHIYAEGQTSQGFWFKSNNPIVLAPGAWGNAYVYAKNPYVDPLVYVSGFARCSTY